MQSLFVFLDLTKFADFWRKTTDARRGVSGDLYVFRSSLGKVQLCQGLSL